MTEEPRSSVVIGLRTKKTKDNIFGYTVVDEIPSDEACVIYFGGSGAETNRSANGYAKIIKNEIIPSVGEDVPVYTIAYHFDEKDRKSVADNKLPKQLMYAQYHMWRNKKEVEEFQKRATEEDYNPAYVNQLLKKVILNRISEDGKKLPVKEACKRIRKLNIVAHCHGGYVALKLEEKMQEAMQKLGYSAEDSAKIQSQLLVVAHSPECPLGVSKSQFISFMSVYDDKVVQADNWMRAYIRMREEDEKKRLQEGNVPNSQHSKFFCPMSFFPGRQGNFFLVKSRMEETLWSIERGEYMEYRRGEHEDINYNSSVDRTEEGDLMALFAKNILVNGIKNSLQQNSNFSPLPSIDKLVLSQDSAQNAFIQECFQRMQQNGKDFWNLLKDKYNRYNGLRTRQ